MSNRKHNPIGTEKPHAFLQKFVKNRYKVVLDIQYSKNGSYICVDGREYTKYCRIAAYNNLDELNNNHEPIAIATSCCSNRDNYDRHLGLSIALRRLNVILKDLEISHPHLFKN